MKIRLVVALLRLAIGFTARDFAQQKDTVDPQLAEQLSALSKKTGEAGSIADRDPSAATATHRRACGAHRAFLYRQTGDLTGQRKPKSLARAGEATSPEGRHSA
jgi:hypothetical protein